MSAFLGPIHYWLYNKIQLQEDLIQTIIDASIAHGWDANIEEKVDEACGKAERRALEEIIDQGNIHGWLQYQIQISEARFAFVVTALLKEEESRLEELKKLAFSFGEKNAVASDTTADEAFKVLNDNLLDGMPCDRVNETIEESSAKTAWRQLECIHHEYWDEVEGDVKAYYELRTQMIKGILSKSNLNFERSDDGISEIKQEG